MNSASLLALGSAMAFATAGLIFTFFARKLSVAWTNAFKSCVALTAFSVTMIFLKDFSYFPRSESFFCFLVSGFLGLCIADFFLVRSYKFLGASRTLMIFSFQPLFLGVLAFLIFDQKMPWFKLVGIFVMIACVFTISYEGYRIHKKWDLRGPMMAATGMLLDGCGILLTRKAFDLDTKVLVFEGNFYRCLGACLGFFIISRFYPIHLRRKFQRIGIKPKLMIISGALLGTFLSLWMYLTAVSTGHLATVAAIVGTSPLFAAGLECIVHKRRPSRFLVTSLILFLIGFVFVIQ